MIMKLIKSKWTFLVVSALVLSGCGTLHKTPVSLSEVASDTVILVGRIEVLPKVDVKDKDLKLGTFDPFNVKEEYRNRAILYLSDKVSEQEPTKDIFNPKLDETYFFRIPKDKRFLVYGSVFTYYRVAMVDRRQMRTDTNEIVLPVPVEFDIRPTDKAVYVGTWRFQRDEFNEITKAEMIDQYQVALAEFRKQFGPTAELRKALAKPAGSAK
jgi:hypothetical protein